MARRHHRAVGQFGRRAPHDLRAERQFQPLQPVQPAPKPVQPGVPGGRQHRAFRLHVRTLLFQRACAGAGGDAVLQPLERQRHGLHDQQRDRHSAGHLGQPGLGLSRLVVRPARQPGQVAQLCRLRAGHLVAARDPARHSWAAATPATSATARSTRVSNVATPYALHFNNNRFDPMATIAVDVTPTINIYARYATGYRAGGANDRSSDFRAFGPEAVKSYEARRAYGPARPARPPERRRLYDEPHRHPDRLRLRRCQSVPAGHDDAESDVQSSHREYGECAGHFEDPRRRGGPDHPRRPRTSRWAHPTPTPTQAFR